MLAQVSRSRPRGKTSALLASVNGLGKPEVKGFADLYLVVPLNRP
jgi:hypothetical protein